MFLKRQSYLSRILTICVCCAGGLAAAGEEKSAKFEPQRTAWTSAIGESESFQVFEGLPHQNLEADALAKELKSKKTIKSHGFAFYATPLAVAPEIAKRLAKVCSQEKTFKVYGGPKFCGGFHPDWRLVWTNKEMSYEVLICFGCHEARLYGPKIDAESDLESVSYETLKKILTPLQTQRPKD